MPTQKNHIRKMLDDRDSHHQKELEEQKQYLEYELLGLTDRLDYMKREQTELIASILDIEIKIKKLRNKLGRKQDGE